MHNTTAILHLVFLIVAVILFTIDFFPGTARNLMTLGLAFFALSFLF